MRVCQFIHSRAAGPRRLVPALSLVLAGLGMVGTQGAAHAAPLQMRGEALIVTPAATTPVPPTQTAPEGQPDPQDDLALSSLRFVATSGADDAGLMPSTGRAGLLDEDWQRAARPSPDDGTMAGSPGRALGQFHLPTVRAVLADPDPIDTVKISAISPIAVPVAVTSLVPTNAATTARLDQPADAVASNGGAFWLVPPVLLFALGALWLTGRPSSRGRRRSRSAPI